MKSKIIDLAEEVRHNTHHEYKKIFDKFLQSIKLEHGRFNVCDDCKYISIVYNDLDDPDFCLKCGS